MTLPTGLWTGVTLLLPSSALAFALWLILRERASNEQRFRLMVDSVKDYAIFMLDADGRVAGWNAGAERIKGYREPEIVGRHFSTFYTHEDRGAGRPAWALQQARDHGRVEDEGWRVRKDGSRFVANVVITALRDEVGNLVGFVKVTRDITTRKQSERELRSSEARYRLLVEDQTELIALLRCDGTLLFVNQAFAGVLGLAPEKILGTSVYDYLPHSERELVRASFQTVCDSGTAAPVDSWLTAANGECRWIAWRNRAVTDDQGKVTGVHSVGRDITDRRRAEAALRDSEQRLRMITDNMPGLVSHLDKELRFRFVNQAYGTWFEVDPAKLIGTRIQDLYGEHWSARDDTGLQFALSGNPVTAERDVVCNGLTRHCQVVLLPERDASGQVVGLLSIHTDITQRRRTEMALRASESFLARTGAVAGVGGWEMDLLADTITWSPEIKRMHGLPPDYVPTLEAMLKFHTPESRRLIEKCFRDCINRAHHYDLELELVSADGRHFWVRSTGAAEFEDGRAVRIMGALQDITERREGAQRLQEITTLLTSVLDSASEIAIISSDPELNITVFNKGAERLLGYSREEIVGRANPTLFHDPEEVRLRAEELSARVGHTVTDGAVFIEPSSLGQPREWTYIRKDGTRVVVTLVITAMYTPEGKTLGYVGIALDITRQAQYEQTLRLAMADAERANKAKSEFLANMSHEIRTPLNAVIGLGYLLEQTPLNADQRQFVAKIEFAGRSLLSVVNNVLDLSKIEAGEMLLEEERFDLPELLTDIGQMLLPEVSAKGNELKAQVSPSVPRWVKGDVARLRQILTNLVNNAIKFTAGGCVTVEAWCAQQDASRIRLRCEVRDTGIGIEPSAMERLFTPFTQADASTTRRFGGTGLGLSIARRFVDLMGGEIGVTSSVGVGSTFWFEIPLELAVEFGAPSNDATPPGLRILVADSAVDVKEGLGAMVRALGWIPEITVSPEQLQTALATHRAGRIIDVLVSALGTTAADPFELISNIRAQLIGHQMPPIILVADAAQANRQDIEALSAECTLLLRPVSNSSLFNAINAAVWKQSGGRERLLQTTNLEHLLARWLVGVRVMVADDSDINLEVARRILEAQGATVATCSDGKTAVDYVRAHDLDVVLMDVQMPVLDGNQAVQQIREELHLDRLPIIALTAGAMLGERQRALISGMNDVISKPFDPLTLIRKVRYLVEQARGEPIKVVLVDRPTVTLSHGLPVASLDLGVAQQMFGEDLPLFRKVLERILRDYGDLALPNPVALADPMNRADLIARAHKLKGTAGTIGATRVAHFASAVESALRHDRPTQDVERILRQLASALTSLREESVVLLEDRPGAVIYSASEVPVSPSDAKEAMEELCSLLQSRDFAAVHRAAEHAASLRALLGATKFELVRDAIDRLDFDRGAALLRGMRAGSCGSG